ncbi:ABC transporter ATP-binding protein [Bacillus sp. AK128]
MKYILYYIKKLNSSSGKILYLNSIGMVLLSLLEAIGILLLIPLVSISGILDTSDIIPQFKSFSLFFESIPETAGLLIILSTYFCIIVGQNLVQRNLTIKNVKIHEGFSRSLRIEIYSSLLKANWSFFIKKKKTDLVNLLTTELAKVIGGVKLSLQLFSNIVFTIIQVGIAIWVSPTLSIFVLLSGLILSFFSKKFIKKSKQLGKQTSIHAQNYLGGITEQLNGIKDIKSNTLEESHVSWLHSLTARMSQEQIDYIKLRTGSQLFYKVASTFLIALFVFLSLKLFQGKQEQLLLILLIFSRLWPRFTSIQSNLEHLSMSIPAFKFIFNLQRECNKEREFELPLDQYELVSPQPIKIGLEGRNITFRYNKSEPVYSLRNLNFFIPSNQMTAIVGHSGAGKSTLIDLLMGLNRPESGEILIDGKKVNDEDILSLRRSIGYVSQDPFLFNTSIRENLLLIKPDAKEDQLWEALEFASAADFVRKLSQGLDTIIGDRGIRLSGGECQRIVLARAILRKPTILVLDEATSSLDTENEVKIQEAIERLKGRMTIIVIAHRFSTIRNAEQVIVLENGQIIQHGSFKQLASETKSKFSKLLSSQMEAVR